MIENGTILGGVYRITGTIGQGGMGVIYLADHLRLHKKVVVKKIKEHFSGQINGRAEADILKRLHHSYLPQVYDFLVAEGNVYTVMEYVEGRDLQYYLDRKYAFPEETVMKWLLQLAEVLDYLHSQSPPIFHSDMKPANIMITNAGNVCLIDFNISLDGETSKDVQGLSPWYAAPEQYERAKHILHGQTDGIVLDGRMDIYSLGASFYRVMTGYLPSPGEDLSAMLACMDIPYSDGLKAILAKMIRKRPSGRYSSAAKLVKALKDAGRMDPVYRSLGYMQTGAAVLWILCVIAGVLCIYYGSWQNTVEKWQEAYGVLYVESQKQNETAVIDAGTAILNDFTYRSYLNKNTDKKAEVWNILGESYYRQGRYKDAADCYEEAWELQSTTGKYCENYIAALIRADSVAKARRVVLSSEAQAVLSEEKQNLITAELAWASSQTEDVREELQNVAAASAGRGDIEGACRAYLLIAGEYMDSGNYTEATAVLGEAAEISAERDVLRRLGEAAYLAAENSSHAVYRNAYLMKALESYETLNRLGNPSYEDRLNLALVERSLESYESSNRTLKEMLSEYQDEYAVPMWMCYNYLDIAKEQGGYQELEGELKLRYQDARHIYDKSGKSDEDMEQLKEIMNGLEV